MTTHLCPSMECAMSGHRLGFPPLPPPPPPWPPPTPRCPATTRHVRPHSAIAEGVQCKYQPGHDGDHAGWAGYGDLFWPQDVPAAAPGPGTTGGGTCPRSPDGKHEPFASDEGGPVFCGHCQWPLKGGTTGGGT